METLSGRNSAHTLTPQEQSLVKMALSAYSRGWFPMHEPETGDVHWVCPRRRGLIPLDVDKFRISRSLRQAVASRRFAITMDSAFGEVIRACSHPAKGRELTWLNTTIIELFEVLHRAGHAHSVEAWRSTLAGPELVGGLYGLALGSVFCGESMFSDPARGGSNASKVCLVHLVEHLRQRGFTVLDAQLTNPHLEQFGCYEIDQGEYVKLVRASMAKPAAW